MIAKVIAHGADRGEALRRLGAALGETEVLGVRTNLAFVRAVAGHPAFVAGELDTGFIGRHAEALLAAPEADDAVVAAAAFAAMAARGSGGGDPWAGADGWRMNLPPVRRVVLRAGERVVEVSGTADGLSWDGVARVARPVADGVVCGGVARRLGVHVAGGVASVMEGGVVHAFDIVDPLAPPAAEGAGAGHVASPIPGRVVAVLVAPGETVAKGQKLVVLEAMKMELTLSAGAEGVVEEVRCAVGDMVEEGVELVEIGALE